MIGAILGLAGGIGSAIAGGVQNKKNRKFQLEQNELDRQERNAYYWQDREFAEKDWLKTNEYNSPQQQMERLRQAGLNPNLVYGKGAENTATVISRGNSSAVNRVAPQNKQIPFDNAMAAYNSITQNQAQTDNLKANTTLVEANRDLTNAKTNNELTQGETNHIQQGILSAQKDDIIRKIELENKKIEADTQFTTSENVRKAQLQPGAIKMQAAQLINEQLDAEQKKAQTEETREKITHLQSLIRISHSEEFVKAFEAELSRTGNRPSDSWIFRELQNLKRVMEGKDARRTK